MVFGWFLRVKYKDYYPSPQIICLFANHTCMYRIFAYLCTPQRCVGRVVRRRSAKPVTVVRFRYAPHKKPCSDLQGFFVHWIVSPVLPDPFPCHPGPPSRPARPDRASPPSGEGLILALTPFPAKTAQAIVEPRIRGEGPAPKNRPSPSSPLPFPVVPVPFPVIPDLIGHL